MAFQIYNVGGASEVLLQDPRVVADIGIAYLTDLHLSPGRAAAGFRYGRAADWWDRAFGRPAGMLQRLLGEIADAGVELVVFGGDNLDFYDADLARELEEMCAARHLRSCFVLGNHDWESPQSRFETHDVDAPEREHNRAALASIWHMTPPVQAVDLGGIRILLLDMRYQHDVDLHAVVEAHALSQLRELLASGRLDPRLPSLPVCAAVAPASPAGCLARRAGLCQNRNQRNSVRADQHLSGCARHVLRPCPHQQRRSHRCRRRPLAVCHRGWSGWYLALHPGQLR